MMAKRTSAGWVAHKLDELGSVGRGKSKHRPRDDARLFGGPYPFVQTGDVKKANLYLTNYEQAYSEFGLAQSKLWDAGTLCITIAANIADTAVLGMRACFPDSVVGFVADPKKADTRFIKYYIDTFKFRFQAVSHGTTQDNLSLDKLLRFEFVVPSVTLQRRIADIVSAYDDLIENNTKRIRLLQQQTELVFASVEAEATREAHILKMGEIADAAGGMIRTGPFGSQLHESDYTPEGVPVVMPKNLIDGRIDTAEIARIPDVLVQKLAQHKLSEGDIVYGRRGDIGRRAFIRKRQAGWLCGTGCLRISLPGGPLRSRYLHQYLGKPEVVALIAGRAVGATMPNLNTSILRDVAVRVPPPKLQKKVTRSADANDELIDVLVEKNRVLGQQRNLLLPRLISGEIDVSRLEAPGA
ncbi:restriction endonuclease subunit S [Sorangium sp. So ce1153]|uniref:restriction endonuclease subunit S n=1 Tax=Sorangium sp. So ce1153 TaxID=3133333 RepID=UPI003F5EC496